jgi:hypothetical protein
MEEGAGVVSLLTSGLAGLPLGENQNRGPGGQGGPSPMLTDGLGRSIAQTAHPTRFNTPAMSFSFASSEVRDGQIPGQVRRTAAEELDAAVAPASGADSGPIRKVASDRPYMTYGTTFGGGSVVVGGVVNGHNAPTHHERLGLNGDLEYAVWNGEPSSMYNARSLTVYTPALVILSPRSLRKLGYLASILRPMGVVLRVIRGKEDVALLRSGLSYAPDVLTEVVDGVRHQTRRDLRHDIISEQTYTGMGD